jgi:hypothetical protein
MFERRGAGIGNTMPKRGAGSKQLTVDAHWQLRSLRCRACIRVPVTVKNGQAQPL